MTTNVLILTSQMNRQEWLLQRRRGLGGSEAAAIAALSKWKSPVGVYLEKLGQETSPEKESIKQQTQEVFPFD